MALELNVIAGDGTAQRVVLGDGRTIVTAQPGARYRLLDDEAAVVQGASVRRFGNDLVVQGLPEGRELELDNFFGACRPAAECAFALDALGAPADAVLTSEAEPLAALRDGSFLLYGAPEGGTTAVVVPATGGAPGGAEMGTLGTLGAGLIAIGALAGAAGGGGGGGSGPQVVAPPVPATAVAGELVVAPDAAPPSGPVAAPLPPPDPVPTPVLPSDPVATPDPVPPPAAPPPPPPPAPELESFTLRDDRGRVTGPISNGGVTDDLTPRVTLVLDDVLGDGQTLTLRLDGGTERILSSGSTLQFEESRLARGSHTYTAEITDAAGGVTLLDLNGMLPGTGFTFVVL